MNINMNKTISVLVIWIVLAMALASSCSDNDQSQQPFFVPAPESPLVEEGSGDIAIGDVNNDGKLDLLVAHGKGHSITVLLGNGKGSFTSAPDSSLRLKTSLSEMALGDINYDRKLDLAVADHDSYKVTVLMGNGMGGFSSAVGSPFTASDGTHPHTHGLALADVNGDDNLDLVMVNNADDNVSVLLGDGRGGFRRAPGSPFAVGKSPYPLGLGDINGDYKLDIVTPNTNSHNLTVLLGDGKGDFRPAAGSPYPVLERPYFIALGDVNGDHRLDLIAPHDDSSLMTILLNDGRGGFAPAPSSPVDLKNRAWEIVVADANRDSKMDVIAATNNSVTVLLGDGQGRFTPAPGSPFITGGGGWRLAIGDVNGDGKFDVATSNLESNKVTVLLNQ